MLSLPTEMVMKILTFSRLERKNLSLTCRDMHNSLKSYDICCNCNEVIVIEDGKYCEHCRCITCGRCYIGCKLCGHFEKVIKCLLRDFDNKDNHVDCGCLDTMIENVESYPWKSYTEILYNMRLILYSIRGKTLHVRNTSGANKDLRCVMDDILEDYIPRFYPQYIKYCGKLWTIECPTKGIINKKHRDDLNRICNGDEATNYYCYERFRSGSSIKITADTTLNDVRQCVWDVKTSRFDTWYELYGRVKKINIQGKHIFVDIEFNHGS